jgi:hypothetical protein
MKPNLGAKSIISFLLSVLFLILLTLAESSLSRLHTMAKRVIGLALLVLPGIIDRVRNVRFQSKL